MGNRADKLLGCQKGRRMLVRERQSGISLIEIAIALVVLSLLLALAFPSYSTWITNLKVRTAAEKMLSGLQLARNEALRRNTTVRFSLVSNLTSGCTLLSTGLTAIISRADPSSKCNIAISESTDPFISQILSTSEGSTGVTLSATDGSSGARTNVMFNGLGRVLTGANWISRIDVSATGTTRALRIVITPGGQIRMCDPAVISSTDARKC